METNLRSEHTITDIPYVILYEYPPGTFDTLDEIRMQNEKEQNRVKTTPLKSNRNSAIKYLSQEQVNVMKRAFVLSNGKLTGSKVSYLSECLDISEQRIRKWFSNRRYRSKQSEISPD